MKPKLQDYLIIAVALLAIFVSGYGIGYLFAEHRAATHLKNWRGAESTSSAQGTPWQQRTLQRLDDRLALSNSQKDSLAKEIEVTAQSLRDLRSETIRESQRRILELQTRLDRHLDERQRELLGRDRKVLEQKVNAQPVQE